MDNLARSFDADPTSPEHRLLAETAWMGGELISVRYYLGRLISRNLFREPDADVTRRLISYLAKTTSKEGAALIVDEGSWQIAVPLLCYRFETDVDRKPKRKPKEVSAIEAVLKNPSIALADLASDVGTTEKQLRRMSLVIYAMALPIRSRSRYSRSNSRARKNLP